MIVHAEILVVLLLSGILGPVVAQGQPERKPAEAPPSGGPAAASRELNPDVQAITDLLASFVKAYNAKDAKALGELFTPDAEIEDEDGEITRGRDAIVARFAEIFAGERERHPRREHRVPALPGNRSCHRGGDGVPHDAPEQPPRTNRYSVIYARQGGRWLHARIRDEQPDEVSPHEQLLQLEWMLGEWVNESDDGIVKTTLQVVG